MVQRDVSKDVVVVLLILTVLVSILGTWQVTVAAGKIQVPEDTISKTQQSTGLVISEPQVPPVGLVSIELVGDDNERNIE